MRRFDIRFTLWLFSLPFQLIRFLFRKFTKKKARR